MNDASSLCAKPSVGGEEVLSSDSCSPVLRWAGSKRQLIPVLQEYWRPHHRTYIEPFAGSACLFFHLAPAAAILGDYNAELIELYTTLRASPDRLARRLTRIPRTKDAYYRWRSLEPRELDAETRALRFLYLNRHCFNGIYRTNAIGKFNVPFGTRLGDRLSAEAVAKASKLLHRAQLIAGDFAETAQLARPGDLVYMDPPYALERKRNRGEYGYTAFCEADLGRLRELLGDLDQRGVDFVVSYADSREARALAKGWVSRRVRVRRHVAGFSSSRRHAFELLITNVKNDHAHRQA